MGDKCGEKNTRSSDDFVKESNALARAILKPPVDSIWEERIISQVAAFNTVDDIEFPERAFMIGRLFPESRKKKIDGRQFYAISEACDRLASTVFKITYPQQNKFELYPVFAYIKYNNGIISAKLNKELKPHYLQLRREFSLRFLPEFRTLSKVHSQQIYRFLNSWRNVSQFEVSLEELHFLTNASKTQIANFSQFKLRVLDPALKELREKTSLDYQYNAVSKNGGRGGKITHVQFYRTPVKVDDEVIKKINSGV